MVGSLEAATQFGEADHRFDQFEDIALHEQFPARFQGRGDRQKKGRLQDPSLLVSLLEPWVGELNGDPLQPVTWQRLHPALQADVGVAEEEVKIVLIFRVPVALCRCHEGAPDLHPQVVPVRLLLGQGQQELPPC